MEYKNITYTDGDGIAIVTIDRPKVLNALNSETVNELGDAFDRIESTDQVGGVILIGGGDKSFVAGADIGELSRKNTITGREFAMTGQAVLNKIEQLHKPVIAAVNGFALGGGCELAMACHLRVAAAHAIFGQPEVGLGIIPGYGGTQRLPRLVGKGRALEIMLGGGMINASEAYRIGLANCVVETYKKDSEGNVLKNQKGRPIFDRGAFLSEVAKMLRGFLAKGPIAAGYIIEAVNRGLDSDLQEGLNVEADLFSLLCATTDMKEGLAAFLEKREAKFTGN